MRLIQKQYIIAKCFAPNVTPLCVCVVIKHMPMPMHHVLSIPMDLVVSRKNYEYVVAVAPECIKKVVVSILPATVGLSFVMVATDTILLAVLVLVQDDGIRHASSVPFVLTNNIYQVARMDHLTALLVNHYLSSNLAVML